MSTDLRFGIIGWGYWGPKIARNLDSLAHAAVTMVADLMPQRLAALRMQQPWLQTTIHVQDLLTADLDGIVIATPVHTHYQLAKDALLCGKHVLVEKPLTASVREAEELVTLAQRQHLTLMVGHTFEYSPAINKLRQLIQSGELGRIYSVESQRVNLGLFRNDVNVIWDLAPHDISILLYLFNTLPLSVSVQSHAHLHSELCDGAHMDLAFADEITAHIHVSWLYPYKLRRMTVIGDARMAVYDETMPSEMLKIYDRGVDLHTDASVSYRHGAITLPYIDPIEPLRLECEDFVHAIRTGERPRAHGEVGLAVVRVLEYAVQEERRWKDAKTTFFLPSHSRN